jgi:hypothetical protein
VGELPVELAGDVPLEAAPDFSWGLSLGGAPGDVGAGAGAAAYPGDGDGAAGAVKGPVAAAVEPVPYCSAAAGRDGAGAAERGKCGLAAAPPGVGEAHDGLRGADRPDAIAAGEPGSEILDDGQQLGAVVLELVPGLVQRQRQAGDLGLPDGLLTAGARGQVPPGQGGKTPFGQGLACALAVGIVTGAAARLLTLRFSDQA